MSRIMQEPTFYKNQQIIDDFNDLQIRIKTHLFDLGDVEFKSRHPKPTNEELNEISQKIISVLMEDGKPMRRH